MNNRYLKIYLLGVFFTACVITFSSCSTPLNVIHKGESSIVEKKLGETGLKVKAGYNPKKQVAWVSLIADLTKLKDNAVKKLQKWFPDLKIQMQSLPKP